MEGGGISSPHLSMCLNAHPNRLDAESETLIPVNRCGFDVTHALTGEGFDASEDGTGRGTPIVPVHSFDARQSDVIQYGPLDTDGHSQAVFSIMPMNSGKDFVARETDVAQPLMAGGPVGGNQGGDYIASSGVRRIMPIEAERLQGFPDGYTDVAYRAKPTADGNRYKMLGNSQAVPVVRWILKRIEALL